MPLRDVRALALRLSTTSTRTYKRDAESGCGGHLAPHWTNSRPGSASPTCDPPSAVPPGSSEREQGRSVAHRRTSGDRGDAAGRHDRRYCGRERPHGGAAVRGALWGSATTLRACRRGPSSCRLPRSTRSVRPRVLRAARRIVEVSQDGKHLTVLGRAFLRRSRARGADRRTASVVASTRSAHRDAPRDFDAMQHDLPRWRRRSTSPCTTFTASPQELTCPEGLRNAALLPASA
jgi:hypothetical protein